MNNAKAGRRRKHAQLMEFWRRFRKNKTAVLGLIILVIILGTALFADLIIPYSKCIEQVGADRLQGPSAAHFFGTDEYGRDLFARVVHGSRYSLLIGLATSLMALVIGAILGASAGYFGGWVDNIIEFDGKDWVLMDPTLAANNSSKAVAKYIGDGSKYTVKYSY